MKTLNYSTEKTHEISKSSSYHAFNKNFITLFRRQPTPHSLLPEKIKKLHNLILKDKTSLLSTIERFTTECMRARKKYISFDSKISRFKIGEQLDDYLSTLVPFGEYLSGLGKNNCFQRNKRFTELFEKLESIGFFSLKENCRQNKGCVKGLKFISKKQSHPSDKDVDIFTTLSDKYQESEECCSLDSKECSAGIDKSIEKSLSVKNSEQICKNNSDKAKFNKAKSAAEQVGKLCEKPVSECMKFADEELKKFKQEFLKCFVLPGLDGNLNNHVFEECKEDISYIVRNFNKNIKSYKDNGGEFIGEPPEGLSFDTSKFVVDYCQVPLERLKESAQEVLSNDDEDSGAFKKRVSKLWSKACKKLIKKAEKEADKADSNTEGASPSIVAGGINYSGSGGSYSGSGGSYSSSTGYSGSNGYSSTAGSGNSDWNRLDPKYFPKKYVPNISGSSGKFSSSSGASDKSSTSSYTGPPDPFKPSYQRSGSTGNHLKVDFGQLFDSSNKKDVQAQGEKGYSISKGKGARSPASSVRGESWSSSGSSGRDTGFIRRVFYRGGKDSNRETASDDGENISYPTVQSVFQVHTKETNLMNRQRELIQTFCKVHQCNYDI